MLEFAHCTGVRSMDLNLVRAGTRAESNGDGEKFDVSSSSTRTFLCTLTITDQIEQESLDISIWGSADGENWGAKPLLRLPQRFYRGETKSILDLTLHPGVRFIRPRWELNRWGRVAPVPMFEFGVRLSEVPAMQKGAGARRPAMAS
ncbi:MAG TPA: hypothetical protein VEU31_02085 [Candidatus Acidoferrales bacterium]|nr:hypothetical protein [Candidatus Acidoferrales bacterium]